ncbi:flavodoxin domain-containing protein [Paenibacillus segetis]|uniref:Flavodoxin n=1 Tax=Paenibacillus segetis TaxID=1325360 RepID=A0ABQ1Y6Q9_9BACL|nr:flavodoxin domain-containing protein [Paenibacillus segetis]GGH13566.1 flavodoxin [Paenibacillus segetis]
MSTLILYAGKYGSTKTSVDALKMSLNNPVTVIDLHQEATPDLSNYDKIIIGGSIYFGQFQKVAKQFCIDNLSILKQKQLGLFICCGSPENIEQYWSVAVPSELLEHAIVKECFGGELNRTNMNFFDKLITGIITKAAQKNGKPAPEIFLHSITKFSEEFNLA